MTKLFFDTETLPAGEEKKEILKEIHQKRTKDGKETKTFEEYLEGTGLDGAFGRIACIGYAFNDEPPKTFSGEESEILKSFWEIAKMADLFIGFNILDFDLRFIYQRSVILKIKPSIFLPFSRYRDNPIYDVMWEWCKWGTQGKISLDKLAKALDLPTSKGGDVEGKNVAKAFGEGRIKEICKYCEKDVELTRKIYERMTFEE